MNSSTRINDDLTPNPIETFFRSWRVYREIIENDYMFHREISSAVDEALASFKPQERLRILDLGCGDASMILPMMSRERVEHYFGCDLSQPALDMADRELAQKGIDHDLLCGDMLRFACDLPDKSVDFVFSSYALHHLNEKQKHQIIQETVRALVPGGCFVLVDIFREPEETRPDYMTHYMDRLQSTWVALSSDSRQLVVDHATQYDFPEHTAFYETHLIDAGCAQIRRLAKHTWHEAWIAYKA